MHTPGHTPEHIPFVLTDVAKYLNINAGGGAEPAKGHFAVVFHGEATLAILNDDAYAAKFNT